MNLISASIVIYKTLDTLLYRLLDCIHASGCIDHIYVIDNSPQSHHQSGFEKFPLTYIWTQKNLGYGSAHNIALRKAIELGAELHFVINPDIAFEDTELIKMVSRLRDDPMIGLLMPKVIYPDGSLQYLCKLLPTPIDLLIRRFMVGPLAGFRERLTQHFELRFTGYSQEMNVPFLSGCFMLLKIKALKQVGIFDESFFMYGEDIDLSRRIHTEYKTLFFPGAHVVHDYAKASYKSTKMLLIHMINIARYFNKWGWIFDSERKKVNVDTLKELKKPNKPSK